MALPATTGNHTRQEYSELASILAPESTLKSQQDAAGLCGRHVEGV